MSMLFKTFCFLFFLSISLKATENNTLLTPDQVRAFYKEFDAPIRNCENHYQLPKEYKGLSALKFATISLEDIHSLEIKPEILQGILVFFKFDPTQEKHFSEKYLFASDSIKNLIKSIMSGVGVELVQPEKPLNQENSNTYIDCVHAAGRYMKPWQKENEFLNAHLKIGSTQVKAAGLEFARLGSNNHGFMRKGSEMTCVPHGALYCLTQNEELTRELAPKIRRDETSYYFNTYEIKENELEKIGKDTNRKYIKCFHSLSDKTPQILKEFDLYFKSLEGTGEKVFDDDGYSADSTFKTLKEFEEKALAALTIEATATLKINSDGSISYTTCPEFIRRRGANISGCNVAVTTEGVYEVNISINGDFIIHRMGGSGVDRNSKNAEFGHAYYYYFDKKIKKWIKFDNIHGASEYIEETIPPVDGFYIFGDFKVNHTSKRLSIEIPYQKNEKGEETIDSDGDKMIDRDELEKSIEAYKALQKPQEEQKKQNNSAPKKSSKKYPKK